MSKHPKIGIRPTIDGRQGGVRESLEEKTMNLAKAVAELISANVRYSDGVPVECVIADGTIGRVAESAACAAKFEREGVGATISVTSCWCYGSETMDMNPHWPKAVWGFNGTERPGAVYLAAVLAGHAQKGLPAFGIYGHDVQDLDDNTIPADVAEKILRWARAAVAVAQMRGESYLSVGSQCMGIAGSIVDQNFFQEYLGMRNESVDETEVLRRMEEGIYDHEEYAKAMAWTEKYCKCNEGWDKNRPEKQKDRAGKDADWEFVVKMTIIIRDLMLGNPRLKELGFKEEAIGHNAIAAGFQGQRQWTDWKPNGDFTEALLCSTFDWNGIRESYVLATENDAFDLLANDLDIVQELDHQHIDHQIDVTDNNTGSQANNAVQESAIDPPEPTVQTHEEHCYASCNIQPEHNDRNVLIDLDPLFASFVKHNFVSFLPVLSPFCAQFYAQL